MTTSKALPPRRVALTAMAVRRGLKQLADALVPPEVAINDIATCMGITQVATAFAELGIADVVGDRECTAAHVAAALDTDDDFTHRLVRTASGFGLCRMNPRTGTITLTRTGRLLRSDHPRSLRAWVMLHGSRMQTEAWTHLAGALRSGGSAFAAAHGMSLWEWLPTHPTDAHVFDEAMRRGTTINADIIAAAYPWPDSGVVCDIGGGVGTLLSAIIASSTGLRGVVVDSPDVVARADSFLKAHGLDDRIDAVAGDMFGTIPTTADVYLLKDVLHDWDDEHCRKILSTVAAAMPSGSRVVLVELLQQPNTPNPLAPWADLLMLTQTDGGRQRSVHELAALLTDAGLRPTGTVRHAIPHDMVEAVKP
jgi:O-methyltransferase domain